jgi:hypothetical protein
VIEELLFSKPHDHNKYTTIEFWIPQKDDRHFEDVKRQIEIFSVNHCVDSKYIQPKYPIKMEAMSGGDYKQKYLKYESKVNDILFKISRSQH